MTWIHAARRQEKRTLPAPNNRQTDARSLERQELKQRLARFKELAPFVLPPFGMRLRPQKMSRLIAAFGASF
jgi:hypothetical protein